MSRNWVIVLIVALLVVIGVIAIKAPRRAAAGTPPAIAAGAGHNCRIIGTVVECWGGNGAGQLGNGRTGTTVPIAGRTGALGGAPRAVAAGNHHSCAVVGSGVVSCWGENSKGQLGNNTTASSSSPVAITINNAIDVAAGAWHTCAALSTGAVQCWGHNHAGQLGDGSKTERLAPVSVPGISDARQISSGFAHTCVLHNAGTVSCWGGGAIGNSTGTSLTPVAVPGITGAQVVVAGFTNTCAVLAGGTVSCWGANPFGELGDGTTTSRPAPGAVSGITGATAIAVGGSHGCAVVAQGALMCWGQNSLGQLGLTSTSGTCSSTPCETAPVTVPGISGAIDVTAGDSHTCVLFPGGRAECFGWNGFGQLGNGQSSIIPGNAAGDLHSAIPVRVTRKAIAVGGIVAGHTCALVPDGTARCWGTNDHGQLGTGAVSTGSSPGLATPVQAGGVANVVQVMVGGKHSCALLSDASMRCWGWNVFGQLGSPQGGNKLAASPAGPTLLVAIGGGKHQTCAIRSSSLSGSMSRLFCWGVNNNFQLGAAPALPQCTDANVAIALECTHVPVNAPAVARAVTVRAGAEHACALAGDGRVWCWGQNIFAQTGAGNVSAAPHTVLGISGATSLAVGWNHNCVVAGGGSVTCWGDNRSGQIGNGATSQNPVTVPFTIPGITTATAVAGGGDHTCALLRDGTVRCWGQNALGQLGRAGASSPSPVTVTGITDATAISAGGTLHTCVVVESGAVRCWGVNSTGELGRGTTSTFEAAAADVVSLP